MSRHLKRLNAPKSWTILRKTTKYIAKPLPGAHALGESMPIGLVLKQLGHAQTTAEAKKILHAHPVLVDGKRVLDPKSPVGILDSIALPTTNGHKIASCHPRRTLKAEMTWPNHPPKTAMAAASLGSIPHTQIDIATIANAKPEMPCTKPATAAPNANSQSSIVCPICRNQNNTRLS